MSTPITASMPLSVQNPAVKGFFEPIVMSRSRVVRGGHWALTAAAAIGPTSRTR